MQKRNKRTKTKSIWLVDYDLEDAPCRQRFYREVKKVMGKTGLADASSSFSVVAVKDKEIPKTVYDLAAKCGRAHLYKAMQADELP
jgi:hypothetical protein